MVYKKGVSNIKRVMLNKAITLFEQGKHSISLNIIKKTFGIDSDVYLFFLGWLQQIRGEHEKAILNFEKSLLKNPLNEDTYNGLTSSYLELGDYAKALLCAQQAIIINSNNPINHYIGGLVLAKINPTDDDTNKESLNYLLTALDLVNTSDTKLIIDIYIALGGVLLALRRYDLAKTFTKKALESYEFNVVANKNLTSILGNLGEIDEAIKTAKLAQMTDNEEEKVDAIYQEGMLQLLAENYPRGWFCHEARLQSSKFPQKELLKVPYFHYRHGKIDKLLVFQEQGIGDTMQFSRYLPYLRKYSNTVDLLVSPNIYNPDSSIKSFINSQYGEYIDNILVKGVDEIGKYNYCVSLMSLPYTLGLLNPLPQEKYFETKITKEMPGNIKIGICWCGSNNHVNNKVRSIPVDYINKLIIDNPDITFIPLQLPKDINCLIESNVYITETNSLEDTLAVVKQCDYVITVDSMIAHLAAGANVPTWILLSFSPDWRWGMSKNTSDWYNSVKLFRQTEINNWRTVITSVQHKLNSLK